jgi:hypothetical protein
MFDAAPVGRLPASPARSAALAPCTGASEAFQELKPSHFLSSASLFLRSPAAPIPCGANAGHAVSVARNTWARQQPRLVRERGESALAPQKIIQIPPPAPIRFPRSSPPFSVSSGQSYRAIVLSVSDAFPSLTYRARSALLSGTRKPSSGHPWAGEASIEHRPSSSVFSEYPDAAHRHIGVTTQRIILIRESHESHGRIEPLQLQLWPASPASEGGRPV